MNVAQVVTKFASRARRTGKGQSRYRCTVDLIHLALLSTQAIEEMWQDPKLRPSVEVAKSAFRVMPTTFVHHNAFNAARAGSDNVGESVRAQMNRAPSVFSERATDPKKRGRRFSSDVLNVALRRFQAWVVTGTGIAATDIFRPPIRDERERGPVRTVTVLAVRSGKVLEIEKEREHVADDRLRASFAADHRSYHRRLILSNGSDYRVWAKEFERFVTTYAPHEIFHPLGYFNRIAHSKLDARQRSALKRSDGRYDKMGKRALRTAFRQVLEARFRRLLRQ